MRAGRLSAIFAAALAAAAPAWASLPGGWLSGGRPVTDAGSTQSDPVIAPDGAGGAFIAWQDSRSPYVYAQHLTATGDPAPGWPASGLAFSGEAGVDPVIVADGRGGAFVAASTGRSIDVHHLAADGTVTPGSPTEMGVTSVEKVEPTVLPFLLPDDQGGAFMAWIQGYWLNTGLKVARIAPTGGLVPGWGGGLPSYPYNMSLVLCSDGAGGVIVAWVSYRVTSPDIWATRIDASGVRPTGWADTLVQVCGAPGMQKAIGMVPDGGGGAIIVWQDSRNGSYEQVFAQRITSTGSIADGWLRDGNPVCSLPSQPGLTRYAGSGIGAVSYSSVASDGAGGALIAWSASTKDGGDIYMQHLLPDASLALGWPSNGLPLCAAPGSQLAPSLAADGTGGAFVTWQDGRSPDGIGVYAQHVRGDGSLASGWTADGVPLCPAPLDHLIPRIAADGADGAGGAIVAWQDLRCSGEEPTPEVFASHVAGDGALPSAPGIVAASASPVSSRADSGSVRVVWRTAGAPTAPVAVYCRQIDGPWIQVGTAIPDADGTVTYADVGAIAGCRYGYAVGLVSCGAERIVGQTWVDIPNGAGFLPLAVSSHSAAADSGRVRLTWELAGGEALRATVLRRDPCSTWTALDSMTTGDEGQVTIEDRDRHYEGHTEIYRIRVHACGQDFDLGEFSTVIPQGHGFVPTTATLTHQEAGSGGVYLTWQQQSGPPSVARIYRRDSTMVWTLRATSAPDASGVIRYLDSAVEPGAHYEYRLGLQSCDAEPFFGPVSMDIPNVSIGPRELALHSAAPSPARGEVTVLFTLPGDDPASLEVFDVRGRRLLARQVGGMGPGDHALVLADATTLSPGIYMVRLNQGGRSLSMRVALVY